MNIGPDNTPERRAAVVAGVRALADLIETTDVPVPDTLDAQYSILADLDLADLDQEGIDLVRAVAARLGVEPKVTDNVATARKVVVEGGYRSTDPALRNMPWFRVSYVIHASKPAGGDPA